MPAKSRYTLRYRDAQGRAKEELFGGRGSFTKAGIGRVDQLKAAGITGVVMVKQTAGPNGHWTDGNPFRFS